MIGSREAVVGIALALAACGRIGFDETRNRDSGSSGEAGEADAPVDTALACTPVACLGTAMAVSCNGRCFTTCTEVVSWSNADARCLAWGGRSAILRDVQDETCLVGILGAVSWLGYRQPAGQSAPGSGWGWVDGTPNTYVAWGIGEPQDGDNIESDSEQCTQINGAGDWADQVCPVVRAITCSR